LQKHKYLKKEVNFSHIFAILMAVPLCMQLSSLDLNVIYLLSFQHPILKIRKKYDDNCCSIVPRTRRPTKPKKHLLFIPRRRRSQEKSDDDNVDQS
jgi:hypothetical protein